MQVQGLRYIKNNSQSLMKRFYSSVRVRWTIVVVFVLLNVCLFVLFFFLA